MLCNGLFWGSLLLLYSNDWPLQYQFMAWIVYPGIVAGSVISLASYFPAFIAFVAPLVVSCFWALMKIEGNEYGMLLLIVAIFFICIILAARKYSLVLIDAIEARLRLQGANRKLMQLATRDVLTGVPNRRAFNYQLEREWRRNRREKTPLALLMVDVDHFKAFNDRFGHTVGDSCLKNVATAIADQLQRGSDLACRYGGEEFALLLPNTDRRGATGVAESILSAVRRVEVDGLGRGERSPVTVSIGIACCIPGSSGCAEQLIEEADRALYEAKRSGRNRAI